MRRAPAHEQGQHAALFDQAAGIGLGLLHVERIVQCGDFDLLATHAALGVDVVEVELGPGHGLFDRGRHRAGDTHGLTDADLGRGGEGASAQRTRHQHRPELACGRDHIMPSQRGNHSDRPGQ